MSRRILAGWSATACLLALAALATAETAATDPKEAGLYLTRKATDGSAALVKLRGGMAQMRQKGIVKTMLLMGAAKPTMVAELSGDKAEVRAKTGSPAFSFFLPPGGGGMEDAMRMMSGDAPPAQARNGAEFVLVRFKVKDGSRQAEVGQDRKSKTHDTVPCSSESLGNSLYRVAPKESLPPGEYGFYWAEHGFSGMIWDFGVDQP